MAGARALFTADCRLHWTLIYNKKRRSSDGWDESLCKFAQTLFTILAFTTIWRSGIQLHNQALQRYSDSAFHHITFVIIFAYEGSLKRGFFSSSIEFWSSLGSIFFACATDRKIMRNERKIFILFEQPLERIDLCRQRDASESCIKLFQFNCVSVGKIYWSTINLLKCRLFLYSFYLASNSEDSCVRNEQLEMMGGNS